MLCSGARGDSGAAYKVVCKLQSWQVRVGVFKVDDHQLLVLVRWKEKRRFASRHKAKDVAILGLGEYISK